MFIFSVRHRFSRLINHAGLNEWNPLATPIGEPEDDVNERLDGKPVMQADHVGAMTSSHRALSAPPPRPCFALCFSILLPCLIEETLHSHRAGASGG